MRSLTLGVFLSLLLLQVCGCDDPPRPRQSAIDGVQDDVREDVRQRRQQSTDPKGDSRSGERETTPSGKGDTGVRKVSPEDQEEDEKDARADRPTSPDDE